MEGIVVEGRQGGWGKHREQWSWRRRAIGFPSVTKINMRAVRRSRTNQKQEHCELVKLPLGGSEIRRRLPDKKRSGGRGGVTSVWEY